MLPSAEMIRLFIALDVPVDLRAQLEKLPRKGLDAKWSHGGDFHITIRFLGDIESARVPEIEEALVKIRSPSFGVEVRGLSHFDNKKQSVLHVAVQSVRRMENLCADVSEALTPLGFDFGSRPFIPHVTVARVKGRGSALDDYTARHGHLVAARWQAAAFHLMRSAPPDRAGRRYTILHTYPLLPSGRN
jgi:2'-5' RNA ligase